MRVLIKKLSNFLEETIAPRNIANKELNEIDFRTCSAFILKTASALQIKIQDRLDKGTLSQEHIISLTRTLTSLSDRIYKFIYHPLLKRHSSPEMIRNIYKYSCNQIEGILTLLEGYVENKIVPISSFSVAAAVMRLKKLRKQVESQLIGTGINPSLKDIILFSIEHRIRKRGITWSGYYSLEFFMNLLLKDQYQETTTLINALIRINFNAPEFFLYCTRMWRNNLLETEGLEQQLEIVIREKHRIYELSVEGKQFNSGGGKTIAAELQEYLSEQYLYLKNLLKLRKSMQEKENSTHITKFPVNLSVPQFGLFIRLQIEKGILPKERVGQLFNFFATHFYTAGTRFISADSLQKKSTDVEFATARQMKGQLIAMLNWLNANYNLSNYS